MIYLDNAATSWPKPDCVIDAMLRYIVDAETRFTGVSTLGPRLADAVQLALAPQIQPMPIVDPPRVAWPRPA